MEYNNGDHGVEREQEDDLGCNGETLEKWEEYTGHKRHKIRKNRKKLRSPCSKLEELKDKEE